MSKSNNNEAALHGQQLIEQFIRNDGRVLEKTYRHNYKIVRNYVMKNSGTEADAKDVFQEAMMITWLNLREGKFTLKNEFSLGAYIYKISKYKWLDKIKSKGVRSMIRAGDMEFEDKEPEIQDYSETEHKLEYLRDLYNQLDAKCKDVLNKFYYESRRLEEIAAALNYDTGSIRTIKYRCMQKLRKMHTAQQTKLT